jgi:hypothetical protein
VAVIRKRDSIEGHLAREQDAALDAPGRLVPAVREAAIRTIAAINHCTGPLRNRTRGSSGRPGSSMSRDTRSGRHVECRVSQAKPTTRTVVG